MTNNAPAERKDTPQANTTAVSRVRKPLKRHTKEAITAYLFVLPDFVGLLIFVIFPIFFAFYVSFFEWDLINDKVFVGFENYVRMFGDKSWWKSLGRTLSLTAMYVPSLYIISLFLAAVISRIKSKAGSFIKTALLLPFAITSVIACTLWMFLYNEKRGYINAMLNALGISNQGFLGDREQALASIVIVLLWINIGYNMVLFISAIKQIPQSYYEAASIDGAGTLRSFFSITFPLIKETSIFILITTIIASFQIMDLIMVMTKGGPASSTEVAALYIYNKSFNMLDMGYGSTLSVCLFVILLAVSVIQLRTSAGRDKEEQK